MPALVALFDIADCKRLNCHLGHQRVDEYIAEFDHLLKKSTKGDCLRVAGDAWLAVFDKTELDKIARLLDEYYLEETAEIGWQCKGWLREEKKTKSSVVKTKIRRAMRCAYSEAKELSDVDNFLAEILENFPRVQVGLPVYYKSQESFGSESQRWLSVETYPVDNPSCPFCDGNNFDWDDGDGSVYSGNGTCKNCQAEIVINSI